MLPKNWSSLSERITVLSEGLVNREKLNYKEKQEALLKQISTEFRKKLDKKCLKYTEIASSFAFSLNLLIEAHD